MTAGYDLVIRGGTVVDGSGNERFDGDVAIRDGRIAAVGAFAGSGAEEIDARGRLVTPGFVDIHTHYDGQVTWDDRLQPSSWHGVTTVVMGNCGVGFAPCRADDRDRLIRLMEGVEDIPFPVLTEGLPWNWQDFPSYLDALAARRTDIDFAAQLPHAALRVNVMGERGTNREPASDADIAAMAAQAEAAMRAGALGFTTSRTLNHRTSDGQPTPTLTAAEDELQGIAQGLKRAGSGVLQFVTDFPDPLAEFGMMRRLVERSGRPLSFSLVQADRAPDAWKMLLGLLEAATADGLEMRAQVAGRPVGIMLGLELTLNPFSFHPSYREIAKLPLTERVAALRDPAFRARLLAEEAVGENPMARDTLTNFARMWLITTPPDYEQTAETTVAARAAHAGVSPAAYALDHLLSGDGRGMIYLPFLNYSNDSLVPALAMMQHKDTVLGLSDGGAHVGTICDGSFPTSMLVHWTRDRTRGPKLPLEWVIKAQSADTAAAVGLHDRGLLRPGYKADLNIIDYDRLTLHAPEVRFDLPAGGKRLVQRADGYAATIVSGQVTYRHGTATSALPGRLVRGGRKPA
ncbi:amidohydrolase family protein [Sphingoaurantiacus capsulatus]|uniref:Amidohydrolase family protein n=1 Tax=Sphingoaurantiacus capsulatus TaxID=1771310 RepID=A0ABV7XA81_9SPHN